MCKRKNECNPKIIFSFQLDTIKFHPTKGKINRKTKKSTTYVRRTLKATTKIFLPKRTKRVGDSVIAVGNKGKY
jgi:hypothetical protein